VGTGYALAGFTTDSTPLSHHDFLFALQWNTDGTVSIKYNGNGTSHMVYANLCRWSAGDAFRLELRSSRFRIFKGSAEIIPEGFAPPTPAK
jgi:hypothetical protein